MLLRIKSTERIISSLPLGSLQIVSDGKYEKWYHYVNGTLKYIKKQDRIIAEELAYKTLLVVQLNKLLVEKSALESYFQKYTLLSSEQEKEYKYQKSFDRLVKGYLNKTSS